MFRSKTPKISIIIIAYNMAREVPRTVQSFLSPYQIGINPDDVEVIVMENGSPYPINPETIRAWPKNVKYINVENPNPSPANALNQGVALAKGEWVCPVIDGARMVTGGLLKAAQAMMASHDNPVIATIGYHLGHEIQQENVKKGYNQAAEDALLRSIDWPKNSYRLFDIASLGASALEGWMNNLAESNVLFMKKSFYQSISGYDEAFNIPGGGLVNLDFFKRCVEHQDSQYILLLGEASFHQYHGGVTTSRSVAEPSLTKDGKTTWEEYSEQYQEIRGERYTVPITKPILYGQAYSAIKQETLKAAEVILGVSES